MITRRLFLVGTVAALALLRPDRGKKSVYSDVYSDTY